MLFQPSTHLAAIALTNLDQVLDVLGEQCATITAARENVLRADAAISTNTMTHGVDVCPDELALEHQMMNVHQQIDLLFGGYNLKVI